MFSGSLIARSTKDTLEKTDDSVVQSSLDMIQKKQEARRLPAVLGMKDLTAFLVLIVVYIPLVSSVQFGGPAAFLYWALGFLTFLVPTAFVTRWLARRFPGAGGQYLWAKRVLGSNWSFFFAFCAWWPSIVITVATIQGSLVFIQYFLPTWFSTPIQQCSCPAILPIK